MGRLTEPHNRCMSCPACTANRKRICTACLDKRGKRIGVVVAGTAKRGPRPKLLTNPAASLSRLESIAACMTMRRDGRVVRKSVDA
ncbi:MAG: hypothetical protein K2R98_28370 [Gemmataceae bacterium]|nr:hypothetical protein [Gemmataceae bacterium]